MSFSSLAVLAQVAPARDSLAIAADVASVVVAAAVLVVLILTGFLFARIHKLLGEIRLGVRQNLGPASDRARAITDNVEFITQVLRSDVEGLHEAVGALSERLTLASDRMEERIEDFNALMEVVQGEAEDVFVDTASTLRGVRESARTIAAARERRPTDGEEPSDEAATERPDDDDATGDPAD